MAGALTSVSFFPQALQVIKTRRLTDISLTMYVIFVAGLVIWVVYGLLLHLASIVICNVVTLIPASVILTLKIQDTLRRKKQTENQLTKAP